MTRTVKVLSKCKNTPKCIRTPYLQLYYRAIVAKAVRYWNRNRLTNQKKMNPEIRQQRYGHAKYQKKNE